ncbi:MAG: fibrobacter succinogenes major paralogous domain-containing protein [Paludibacteraceae bacterium]|nr:fibrobacter succinogenes major paralogous domain-containing protein [Paludibacteraceae bacterium]MBN2787256.1 fibrobacter succinogenes major paralogous domain-containing protein [Paludibacteraceae bacterium]
MKHLKQITFWMLLALGIGTTSVVFTSCKEDEEEPKNTTGETTDVGEDGTTRTVTDIDGNVYQTVTIGTQTWMAENLKVTHYNDGIAIPNVTDNIEWIASTSGVYCDYNNDAANGIKYGHLYNWYAVNVGKLAPAGWHVPTDAEWTTLENYLITNGYNYNDTITGNKIAKALAAKTDWTTSTTKGAIGNDLSTNNRTGFFALPGGIRSGYNGHFNNLGNRGYWWSATYHTNYSTEIAWYRDLDYNFAAIASGSDSQRGGLSVRCVKD